jgi:uncharacterized membrane protein
MTIRNPVEWGYHSGRDAFSSMAANARAMHRRDGLTDPAPEVRTIGMDAIGRSLSRGMADFGACRSDVMLIALIYPLAGLLLIRLAAGTELLPLAFPLLSGFALIGPFAASGLYAMSRQRERGERPSWTDAFNVFTAPAAAGFLVLGAVLAALFAAWLIAAQAIYAMTLGPAAPASVEAFASDVFYTAAGWTMIVVGMGVGALFALAALAVSVVSFPLMIDRRVGPVTAIRTSLAAVTKNPGPMLGWGITVALALALGALPALLGLIVVMPVLGHATWHLYREVVEPAALPEA